MALTPLMQERLKRAFTPRSVAVVGATPDQLSVGMGPLYNLLSAPFRGEVYPVNPKYDSIMGKKCYPNIESIDPVPDVAVLLVNQRLALEMVEQAGRRGVSAVSIVAGGFKEVASGGKAMEEQLRETAFRWELPVIGPNTLGYSNFHIGLHTLFTPVQAIPGPVAVISQSGGVGVSITYALHRLNCGLSHFVGVGNRTVVGFAECIRTIQEFPEARTICLFIEGSENPRRLYEAAAEAARKKPVVVYKAGKNEAVSRATATHTGSLTGEYALYRAMFRQAGMYEVESTREAAVASKALSLLNPPRGNRLCALSFTAGPCIVAMDKMLSAGWELPELPTRAKTAIRSIIGERAAVELQNPVDLTGAGAIPHVYTRVLDAILEEDFDAYLIVWDVSFFVRPPVVEFANLASKLKGRPLVLTLLSEQADLTRIGGIMTSQGVCDYPTPESAAEALNALLARHLYLKREGLQ
ncbi:MAG: CoA-binding protein [Syntrophobacteraceae bacterium]